MADGSATYPKKEQPKLSDDEKSVLLKEVRDRIQMSWEKDKRNRQEAALDLKFIAGDQWPEAVKAQRESEGRPMLTINAMPQFLHQVTNPIREADLSIKTAPVDSKSDPAVARVYDGLLKQIQYMSSMGAVVAAVAEHQTGCGIGWMRVTSDYVDDETFNQDLRIKAIPNPLSVYDDPGAVEPDRCDSKWRFITQMIPKADFKEKYPWASTADVDHPSDNSAGVYWWTDDAVRIAEYWKMVPKTMELALLSDGQTVDMERLKGLPVKPERTRMVETWEVQQYIVSGADILEGPNPWAGKYLPQIPVIGMEVPVESGTYRMSLIRPARDPAVLYNYYRSAAAESIGGAPKAPYILTANMIEGHESQWNTANLKNRPYLLINPDSDFPGLVPKREPPPPTPEALVNEAVVASEDMKRTMGIYDASLGQRSNETSGVGIQRRQIQGDTANYHFGDNLQRSLEYLGRVIVDLIPKIFDTQRIVRILGDDDEHDMVEINKLVGMDPHTQQPIMENDLTAGKFDIRVRIARSADSKRLETADALFEFAKSFPAAAPFIADLVAKNSDWPGADEIAKRLRNLIPPQALVDPDDPEAPQPQGPPDPMADPVVASTVKKNEAQAELYHMQAFALSATTAQPEEAGQPLAPYETDQAQADLHKTAGDALTAHAKAATQNALASKAQADANLAHLNHALELGQAQRGQHEKQAAFANIAKELEQAKAAKMQGRVH